MAKIILQEIDPETYVKDSMKVVKTFAKNKNPLFVSLNRNYDSLIQNFSEAKIDSRDFFFIDAVTKRINNIYPNKENVIFLESPQDLTVLSITLSELIDKIKGPKIIFFDSVTVLFIYNSANSVNKFLNFITNKMRNLDIDIVFFYTKGIQNELVGISSIMDEVKHQVAA